MPIELACSSCGRTLRVADDAAGKSARCPACGNVSRIPAASGAGVASAPVGFPPAAAPQPVSAPFNYSSATASAPQSLPNPFGDPGVAPKPSPFGPQGVNPFGDNSAAKNSANPYQAPAAYGYTGAQYRHQLAGRGKRFLGALLDGVLHMLGLIPGGILAAIMGGSGADEDTTMGAFFVVGFGGVFLIAIGNWILIARTGQSYAKRILGMKIVRADSGQPVGFVHGVVLRIWVPAAINQACSLFGLIDVLWIFGEEQRCVHDLIAQTNVIDV